MNNNRNLDNVALIYSLYALGNSGEGGGGTGTPGTPGTKWFVVDEPLSDGGVAPIGAVLGDLVLDSSGEIFEVINGTNGYELQSTEVVLGGGTAEQKDLYELYVEIAGSSALTEVEFNNRFIELINNTGTIGVTDRIISSDGKSSAIASETGLVINSTADEVDGAVEVHNLKDPVADLDAVNLRYLKSYVDMRLQQFYDWLNGMYVVYGGDCDDQYDTTLHGGDSDGMIDTVINGGDADDELTDTLEGGVSNTPEDEFMASLDGNNGAQVDTLVLNGGASAGTKYSGSDEVPPIMTESQSLSSVLSELVQNDDSNEVTINLNGGGAS